MLTDTPTVRTGGIKDRKTSRSTCRKVRLTLRRLTLTRAGSLVTSLLHECAQKDTTYVLVARVRSSCVAQARRTLYFPASTACQTTRPPSGSRRCSNQASGLGAAPCLPWCVGPGTQCQELTRTLSQSALTSDAQTSHVLMRSPLQPPSGALWSVISMSSSLCVPLVR